VQSGVTTIENILYSGETVRSGLKASSLWQLMTAWPSSRQVRTFYSEVQSLAETVERIHKAHDSVVRVVRGEPSFLISSFRELVADPLDRFEPLLFRHA